MASIDSEGVSDQESNRDGSYSQSADVSESDSLLSSRRNSILVVPEKPKLHSDIEIMKEIFAKLILGEDMSGGAKGVCSALAISNTISNLSATVFGELWRLEPLALQKKTMWRREMDWLLCVCNSIVEFAPSTRQFPSGNRTYEVMTTVPRADLNMNLPALKKLDAMLICILDGFRETEFWYGDRGFPPCPNVPPMGLSQKVRKKVQEYRDCTNQILKAAFAINSNVLAEMEIPNPYLDALPKGGKACLGEIIYGYITAELYSPESLLDCLDLSSEHQTLEIANRIEAAVHVWKLKSRNKHSNNQKSMPKPWGSKVKGLADDDEKYHFLAQRAEMLLRSLRIRFPRLPQTGLDINKVQYNMDVGKSILESYSRAMEKLAFNIMARIDDVLIADDAVKQHTPYASSFGTTPRFDVSPPLSGPLSGSPKEGMQVHKQEKPMPIDLDKLWSSYAGIDISYIRGP